MRLPRSMHVTASPIQSDAVLRVPSAVVDDDLVHRLVTRQHTGKHNAVVVHVRFSAHHGDAEAVGDKFEQLFYGTHARHAMAASIQPRWQSAGGVWTLALILRIMRTGACGHAAKPSSRRTAPARGSASARLWASRLAKKASLAS